MRNICTLSPEIFCVYFKDKNTASKINKIVLTNLQVLQQDLDPGFSVVLAVGHQTDPTALKQLK